MSAPCARLLLVSLLVVSFSAVLHVSHHLVHAAALGPIPPRSLASPVERQSHHKLSDMNPHLVPIERPDAARCTCPRSESFEVRYRSSFSVVRVKVMRESTNMDFTMGGVLKRFIMYEYHLLVTGQFKGNKPKKAQYFYAQSFKHSDLCGLRLAIGKQYLLNLDDPDKHSLGSFRKPGFYALNRCQNHYLWTKLSWQQQRFLLARAK